jgi:hypothetical protein
MKKNSHKKSVAIAMLVALVVLLTPATFGPQLASRASFGLNVASAQTQINPEAVQGTVMDWYDCGTNLFTCALYGVTYFVNKVVSSGIVVVAAIISILLLTTNGLVNANIVQIGFSTCLAFANLGFVLAIIFIAIATILRSQTYGAKQVLWKLVVMAILVNFGLVITGPVIAVANSITNYFVSSMGGQNFVAVFTSELAPQIFTQPQNTSASDPSQATLNCSNISQVPSIQPPQTSSGIMNTFASMMSEEWNSDITSVKIGCVAGGILANISGWNSSGSTSGASSGSTADSFAQTVVALVFSSLILAVIAFTLLVLAVLLIIRYVYLAFLLILLPLAWLMWIFPGTKNQFEKWLHNFIHWTFFPPLSFFFLYLTVLFFNQTNQFAQKITTDSAIIQTTVTAAALSGIMMCAFSLASLFAANSLGITGASAAISLGKSASRWVGGKAGGFAARQGKRAATNMVPQKTMEKLQGGQYRFIPKRLQVAAGVGLSNVKKAGGAKLVDQESAWAKEHSEDPKEAERLLASGGLTRYQRVALLKSMGMQGRLGDNVKIEGQSFSDYIDSDRDGLSTLSQGKLLKDADKALGSDRAMRDANRALKLARQSGNAAAVTAAESALQSRSTAFYSSSDLSDVSKINANAAFGVGSDPDLARAQLKAIAETQPHVIPSVLSRANGVTRGKIQTTYDDILDKAKKDATAEDNPEYMNERNAIIAKYETAKSRVNAPDSEERKAVLAAAAPSIESSLKPEQDRIRAELADAAAELAKVKENSDTVRISGIGDLAKAQSDLAKAQSDYNAKDADLKRQMLDLDRKRKDAEEKAVSDHIDSLTQQGEIDKKDLEERTLQSVESRLGKKRIDQAFATNAFFGQASEQQPQPAEPKTKP